MKTSNCFTHFRSDQSHAKFLHVKLNKMVLIELFKLAGTVLGFENHSPFLNFTLIFVTAGERAQIISTGHHFLWEKYRTSDVYRAASFFIWLQRPGYKDSQSALF